MIPTLGLIGVPGPRWLPPLPVPLFLLWPLFPVGLGVAWLMRWSRPTEAATLRAAVHATCQLRGLIIDVETAEHRIRIRFV